MIHCGDCVEVMAGMEADSFDSIVTDPPYGLEFMGKEWDKLGKGWDIPKQKAEGFIGSDGVKRTKTSMYSQHAPTPRYKGGLSAQEFHQQWATAALRVLKPGGYMLSFGGTRTHHRLMVAIEDAGFEIRDVIMWVYGSGFPKGKGCLKPAYEPIVLARKPGKRVLPLQIDECRTEGIKGWPDSKQYANGYAWGDNKGNASKHVGRWPANLVHDGSAEVLEAFAAFGNKGGGFGVDTKGFSGRVMKKMGKYGNGDEIGFGDTGTAARFFYAAKASRKERGEGNTHPTVKPLSLMRWLVRLITPPNGVCLDPFAGSGSTLVACREEGRKAIGIEQNAEYVEIIQRRLAAVEPDLFAAVS